MKTYYFQGRCWLIAIALLFNGIASQSKSMEFQLFFQEEWNRNIVVAEGEIERGDAERFLGLFNAADRDEFGNVTLILNSGGGDVQAALDLVDIMDEVGVTTIVPPEAICASACASILYVSGNKKAVLDGGALGFHSCYSADENGQVLQSRNALCNDEIAENAFAHGACYGAVDVWTKQYGPQDMAWMGADVACQMGLCSAEIVGNSKSCSQFVDELVEGFMND